MYLKANFTLLMIRLNIFLAFTILIIKPLLLIPIEVELDNTNAIIYTVSFKDGSAIEKFYDKTELAIAKLESKDHNFF